MRKTLVTVLAAAGIAAGSMGAHAATVGVLPANNDFYAGVEGWYNANLYLVAGPGGATITATFVNKEAGFNNRFFLNNLVTPIFTTNSTAPGTSVAQLVAPGLITFAFGVNSASPTVTNGSNVPIDIGPNYFVTLTSTPGVYDTTVNNITPSSGVEALIALDDWGAGPDDNHDDMIVKLTVTGGSIGCAPGTCGGPPNEIPEPSTYALLLAGLLGLGSIARRRVRS
jgi:hypothetical protein